MTSIAVELVRSIQSHCTLGEGPVWDERLNRLWWTDIQESRLHFWDWDGSKTGSFDCPERLGSFGLTNEPDWLVCAFASGFALFSPANSQLQWIARLEEKYRGIRLNDGRVDRQGNFWAGSMVEDEALAKGAGGSLYRLTPNLQISQLINDVRISNSIAWSPDGHWLWFADSANDVIHRYNHEPLSGSLSKPIIFATLPHGSSPDGSDVDAEGALWNAEWGGSCISRYKDGKAQRVALPVTQPTCIAFGGPYLDHIFVTSARDGLDIDQLAAEPEAGNVLILKTSAIGLPSSRFPIRDV